MTLLRRRGSRPGVLRGADPEDLEHLRSFARTRAGIEAFLEPETTVTATTVVLVAADGEWTRRRVGSVKDAQALARKHSFPLYDAATVGYPQRMRDWTARQPPGRRDGAPS